MMRACLLPSAWRGVILPWWNLAKDSGVNQIEPVTFHRGIASARTRSRIYQWSPFSVSTSTLHPRSS